MKEILPVIFAVLSGICLTIEVFINSNLGKIINPKIATFHNLITGSLFIFFIILLKGNIKEYFNILYVNPKWLIGGIFGSLIIYFGIKSVPKLGLANNLLIVFMSQIISGLLIDVYVLNQQELHLYKFIGIILLFIGAYFVIK